RFWALQWMSINAKWTNYWLYIDHMIAEVYGELNKNCKKIEQMLEKVLRADQAKFTLYTLCKVL
ncbi:hypothetical protein HK096_009319, partial [Nowakowskiella sp. JEL0078]